MGASGFTYFTAGLVLHETDNAILVRLKKLRKEVWIPKKFLDSKDRYEVGDVDITVGVRDWFAEKEKLGD